MAEKEKMRERFEAFVRDELGDIPVMENGRYISMKINNYWRTWQAAMSSKEADSKASSEPFAGVVTAHLKLRWCDGCGEGVVDFCRGNTGRCPLDLSKIPQSGIDKEGVK